MSVAELVPSWKGMPSPCGRALEGHSLRGRSYRLRGEAEGFALNLIAKTRGIDDLEAFTKPSLADLPDPYMLADMDLASVRLAEAIQKKQSILVFGDYDVDGAASTAVMVRFCRMAGHKADFFIPDRIEHGYGPSAKALAASKAASYDLVIFVDCGTAALSELADLETDVIVVDHHQPQGGLPPVHACVNPHREDDQSGLGMLCAAGVAFMLCVAARRTLRTDGHFAVEREPDLRELLDVVALATVADVVPLVGPSRLLVWAGLTVMEHQPSAGIKALMEAAGVKDITAGRIGFALGPRINAGGRVGQGSGFKGGAKGVRLLLSEDAAEAAELAAELGGLNTERQIVEQEALEEAGRQAQEQVDGGARIVCVYSAEWHPGVIGIVAGRLKERFGLPVIVGASDGETIKASGRSVSGFDLGSHVIEAAARGLLVAGGGHAVACGLTCLATGWDDFVSFLAGRTEWAARPVTVDCIAAANRIQVPQVAELDLLQPVGQGNPSVSCVLEGFEISEVKPFGKGHLRLLNGRRDLEVVFWRAEDDGIAYEISQLRGQTVSVVGVPKINEWNGRRKVSIEASDVIFR